MKKITITPETMANGQAEQDVEGFVRRINELHQVEHDLLQDDAYKAIMQKYQLPDLQQMRLMKFKWTKAKMEATFGMQRSGVGVWEEWTTKPDARTRQPSPELKMAMQALAHFCFQQRETPYDPEAIVDVHGLDLKYEGDNIGFKVLATKKMRKKEGQKVDFNTPCHVWQVHPSGAYTLMPSEFAMLADVVREITFYISGKRSAQLELLDQITGEVE